MRLTSQICHMCHISSFFIFSISPFSLSFKNYIFVPAILFACLLGQLLYLRLNFFKIMSMVSDRHHLWPAWFLHTAFSTCGILSTHFDVCSKIHFWFSFHESSCKDVLSFKNSLNIITITGLRFTHGMNTCEGLLLLFGRLLCLGLFKTEFMKCCE
jgi:hypothetical protein